MGERLQFRIQPWWLEPAEGDEPDAPEWRRAPLPELPTPPVPGPEWPFQMGALVVEVIEDSPADSAGLRVGDTILEIDGGLLVEAGSLSDRIMDHDPGDVVVLLVSRGGRERTMKVTLGQHPDKARGVPWLGLSYEMVPRAGHTFRFGR